MLQNATETYNQPQGMSRKISGADHTFCKTDIELVQQFVRAFKKKAHTGSAIKCLGPYASV